MSISLNELIGNAQKYILLSQTEDIYITVDDRIISKLSKADAKDEAELRRQAAREFFENEENGFSDDMIEAIFEARKNDVPQNRENL